MSPLFLIGLIHCLIFWPQEARPELATDLALLDWNWRSKRREEEHLLPRTTGLSQTWTLKGEEFWTNTWKQSKFHWVSSPQADLFLCYAFKWKDSHNWSSKYFYTTGLFAVQGLHGRDGNPGLPQLVDKQGQNIGLVHVCVWFVN